MNLFKIFSLITIFTFSCILQASEQSTTMHSINQIAQEQNYEPVNLQAQDFPQIEEGFALCGRYNLQGFFDTMLQELRATNAQDELSDDVETNKVNAMRKNVRHHDQAIQAAEKLIRNTFMSDSLSRIEFQTKMLDIIDNNLDIETLSKSEVFLKYLKNTEFMYPVIKYYITKCDIINKTLEKDRSNLMQFYIDNQLIDNIQERLEDAIQKSALKSMKNLIHAGADINYRYTQSGDTYLHLAASNDNSLIIPSLIAYGADIYALNQAHERPWDVAKNKKIRALLIPASIVIKNSTETTPLLESATINNETETAQAEVDNNEKTTAIQWLIDYLCCKKIKKN